MFSRLYEFFLMSLLSRNEYARRIGVDIGVGCRIYIKSWGTEPFLIKLGDRVTVTSGVIFLTHDGATCLVKDNSGKRHQKYLGITIGDDVFIGVNSIIMPGVNIGNKVIIAAGSVVIKNVSDETVVGGNPASIICNYSDYHNKVVSDYVSDTAIGNIKSYKERVLKACEICHEK